MDRAPKETIPHGSYGFGLFRLEARERRLWHRNKLVSLQPKVFDTLVLLVSNAGHLMTKEDLMAALWADAVVEESNLTKNIWSIRKALGESEGEDLFIETVPRVGYRFVATVQILAPEPAASAGVDETSAHPSPGPTTPTRAESSPPGGPTAPRRLGPYEIVAKVGSGGMGDVYRARDERLNRDVAIKVLPESFAQDPQRLRRFQQEAQAAGSLDHPAITAVHDVGSHDGASYIVTELLEGETLKARLASGPLPVRKAIDFAIQIAEGLAAAHEKGVVHRDLKPENLFVTRAGRVKIMDFGLAKKTPSEGRDDPFASSAATQPGSVLGTSGYMSPEQVRGLPADERSDVFSLGAVAYEMLSGRRAFERETDAETMTAILKEEPPELTATGLVLPADLERIVRHCLEKGSDERFQSARDLAFALRSVAAMPDPSAPPAAPSSVPSEALGARSGTFSARRLLIAVALTAVAICAALFVLRRPALRTSADRTSAPTHARRSLAVLGLRNLSGRTDAEWLGTALSSMVTAELAAGEAMRIVPAENVARRLPIAPPGALSSQTLSSLRNDLNADEVVTGSYVVILAPGGEQIRVDLLVQDAATGETLAAVSETGQETDLFQLVSAAGQELRGKLGLAGPTAAQAAIVKASLPATPEATRLYAEGLARLHRGEAAAARDLLVRATQAQPDFALAHAALSDAWSALGYDQRAQDEARRAFEHSAQVSKEERLLIEARLARAQKKWADATRLYQTLWKAFPDDVEYGLGVAETQTAGGRFQEALATTDSLRRLPPPQGEDPRIDLAEAEAADAVADFPREQAAALRAVAKAGRLNASMILAQARMREASAIDALGDYAGARPKYEEARTLFEQAGDPDGAADAVQQLGSVLVDQGDLSGGRTLYNEALASFRQIGDRRGEAAALTGMINLDWLQAGDLTRVDRELEQLRSLSEEVGNQAGLAWALNGIGEVAWDQGDLSRAMALHRKALAISRQIGKPDWEAWTLECIGNVLHSRGELQAARRSYEDAIAIKKRLSNESGVARTLDSLSDVLFDMGSMPEAARAAQDALTIEKKLGEKETHAETDLTLAQVRIATGQPEEALALAREANAQFEKDRSVPNQALAQGLVIQALLALRRTGEAEEAARRGRVLLHDAQPNETIPAKIACARADAAAGLGKPAREEIEAILQKANRIGWINFQLDARMALAKIDLDTGDSARAKRELESLARDARARGFGRVTEEASRLLGQHLPKATAAAAPMR